MGDITDNLLGRILKGSKYIIGELNLIKYDGKVELDQQAQKYTANRQNTAKYH